VKRSIVRRYGPAVAVGVCLAVVGLALVGAQAMKKGSATAPGTTGAPVSAAGLPANWQKGFVFTAWSRDAYATQGAAVSLEALRRTGANSVALIAMLYQATLHSTDIGPNPRFTQSDRSLTIAARRAQAMGLKVRLRILIDPSAGGSRADISPSDPDAWFVNYKQHVVHYARLARRLGVDTLEIGAELQRLTGPRYSSRWRDLASAARTSFKGRVTYGALFSEYRQINWWDALHEIGIDAYFPVAQGPAPPEDAVVAAWSHFVDEGGHEHRYLHELAAVARRFRRPIVFTELGYPSSVDALARPAEAGRIYSAEEQRVGLDAALRTLARQPWLRGVYIWQWRADPSAGGPGDTDHTVQGKPAERTVQRWFAG
jgi:hypothetical protein